MKVVGSFSDVHTEVPERPTPSANGEKSWSLSQTTVTFFPVEDAVLLLIMTLCWDKVLYLTCPAGGCRA